MTQKDNVKQLIGKSLNAYNNKVLQQIDRIEKKNKQQNHKISMLTNELDNDYLTKKEEGSVISLEHSKEGMVYIDSLEGNTLVNYCTDGSKELTLNGDIDLEGTFVTTTEGVDNGKVDVMCEGNTLVNIANDKTVSGTRRNGNIIITPTKLYSQFSVTHSELMSKLNTTYTIRIEVLNNTSTVPLVANKYNGTFNGWNGIEVGFTGEKIFTYTTGSEYQFSRWFWVENNVVGEGEIEIRLTILEGDWTEKEIPPYFEGMKSVGQDDENGHKIEILSQNKNLFEDNVINQTGKGNGANGTLYPTMFNNSASRCRSANLIKVKPNTDYYFSSKDKFWFAIAEFDSNNKQILENGWTISPSGGVHRTSSNCESIVVIIRKNDNSNINPNEVYGNIQIEEGSIKTDYIQRKSNKKEILLNEPLRSLPNGVKDRFIKIGDKWYVERNCWKMIFSGTESWEIDQSSEQVQAFLYQYRGDNKGKLGTKMLSNKLPYKKGTLYISDEEGCSIGGLDGDYLVYINKSKFNTVSVDEFIKWLQENPLEVVYELATPIYEPLEIEPTLNTYTDVTHISNNSLIPCNMTIKNSGYNAIIKPSTLYTIALDTNKSGTIGCNLGGTKGVTTNNVLTLTTPATLSDDSLRLYGKGIKSSKVRLLEDDKTNWIPSYFEGMKSSFEDKFDATDNTYKVEIISNNEVLFDDSQFEGIKTVNINGYECYDFRDITGRWFKLKKPFTVKKGQRYYLASKVIRKYAEGTDINQNQYIGFSFEPKDGGYGHSDSIFLASGLGNSQNTIHQTVTSKISKNNIFYTDLSIVNYGDVDNKCIYLVKDSLMLKTENSFEVYKTQKHNKIQFSSIEPLRSVGDVKDKFIFKEDGKLMIERNCRQVLGSEFVYARVHQPAYTNRFAIQFSIKNCYKDHILENVLSCNVLPYVKQGYDKDYDNISSHKSNDGVYISLDKDLWGYDGENGANILQRFIAEKQPILTVQTLEPTYEEIPYELQKIILEGYENGTLFFDTNIPPTATITYAGEAPIVSAVKSTKTNVSSNTEDINDNIVLYLMDMDYRVVCLQLENGTESLSMARLFGGSYEMLKRDILSKRLTKEEYGCRITDYFNAGKLTEKEVRELEDIINE